MNRSFQKSRYWVPGSERQRAMARPLDFDRQTVLAAAADLIWARGYNAASLADLTGAMGISRSSVYNTFGSKRELLIAALECYAAAQVRDLSKLLVENGIRDGLRMLFESTITDNNQGRGCLLVNCASEVAPHDTRAATVVREGLNDLTHVIAVQVRQGKEDGELDTSADPEALARGLITFITGLRIMAKAGMDRRSLRTMARQALESLVG
jgi:TetR/AcrR family transcriptional repressor of nem operon